MCRDIVGSLYNRVLDGCLVGIEFLAIDRPAGERVACSRCSNEFEYLADGDRVTTGNWRVVQFVGTSELTLAIVCKGDDSLRRCGGDKVSNDRVGLVLLNHVGDLCFPCKRIYSIDGPVI